MAGECAIDYALGSPLECAACLDITVRKEILQVESGYGVQILNFGVALARMEVEQ